MKPVNFSTRVLDNVSRNRLRKLHPNLANCFITPEDKAERSNQLLNLRDRPEIGPPYIYTVAPEFGSPTVGRIEKNPLKLLAAAKSGYIAMKHTFGYECSDSFRTDGWLEDI